MKLLRALAGERKDERCRQPGLVVDRGRQLLHELVGRGHELSLVAGGPDVSAPPRRASHPLLASVTHVTSSSTYVLVPGAWHGGWAWHPVAQRLREAGHRALALTPPGLGDGDERAGVTLEDAVEAVVEAVETATTGDVVLVGHSWGGVPVTGAAHRLTDRVSRVVYVSAYVPTRGVALNDDSAPENAAFVRAAVAASPDQAIPIPFEAFAAAMMPDEPEALQRFVHRLLVPTPGRYLLDALDVPPVIETGIAVTCVLSRDDVAFALPGQEFADRAGVEPVLVPGGHEALLTHPDEVAAAILN